METISTDFLIVGSGIAGLRAAIGLASAGRVLVLTKADPRESNTGYAQGGIAAAIGVDDSPSLHAADTIRAGDGLCDHDAVRVLVTEGQQYVLELIDWGVRFDLDDSGHPALGLEAAHSVRRILHAGDSTGREIGRTLWQRAISFASIETINHALVTDLVVGDGRVQGARFFDDRGRRREVSARSTLVATGGAGQVFRETTNPGVATGDGVALAYRAGARLADLEFVQFHPTALSVAGAPRFLVSEALRGEGARLVNAGGEPFMRRYHPDADLAPRDVVARSIAREVGRTGADVFLTLAHLDARHVHRRFPTIAAMCRRVGLDLASDRIPVGPAAHYLMGGIDTDESARTSLAGLFAAGEAACTGVHGANRLASNSLLEGLVFGARAAEGMQQAPQEAPSKANRVALAEIVPRPRSPLPVGDVAAVREMMWRTAGLFRHGDALESTVAALGAMCAAAEVRLRTEGTVTPDDWQWLNLVTVAYSIGRAALGRTESRGAHYREDYPVRDDRQWLLHAVDQLTAEDQGTAAAGQGTSAVARGAEKRSGK